MTKVIVDFYEALILYSTQVRNIETLHTYQKIQKLLRYH